MPKLNNRKGKAGNKLKQIEKVIHKRRAPKRRSRTVNGINIGIGRGIPRAPAMGVKVKGKGAYSFRDFYNTVSRPFTDSTASQGLVNRGARAIGSMIGNEIPISGAGNALGNAASWLSRAFGFGAYTVKSNTLMSQNIAQFSDNGSITFAHREFVTDINSSTGFVNQNYLINPGNSTLFPWLSTIATNFEQYEMLGLIFEFKSTSATAVGSVNTGLGTLIMATDYDVLDANYASKRQMEISDFATSSAPCENQIHPVECDPRQNVLRQLFIQTGTTISQYPDDARFSALGNFQIATSGMQAVSTIGELWVSYHVRLHKPQLPIINGNTSYCEHVCVVQDSDGARSVQLNSNTDNGAFTVNLVTSGGFAATRHTCTSNNGVGVYILTWVEQTTDTTVALTGNIIPGFVGSSGCTILNQSYSTGGVVNSGASKFSAFPALVSGLYKNFYAQSNEGIQMIIFSVDNIGAYFDITSSENTNAFTTTDIYLTPYSVSLTSLTKGKITEFEKIQQQLDLLKLENNKLLNKDVSMIEIQKQMEILKRSNDQLKERINLIEDEETECPDLVTSSAINVLITENVDDYTKSQCEDRLSTIHDLLEGCTSSSDSCFLHSRARKCNARLEYLKALEI